MEKNSGNMRAEKGDIVSVEYVGLFTNGAIFDTNILDVAKRHNIYNPRQDYAPFTFCLGDGRVIKGFENAVLGMRVGEKKKVTIPPEEGYGEKGNHPLAGKTLIFEISLVDLQKRKK
ncbi:MAG: FKBP-type peptidyl-prolyl cis-trans isomerase [Thermoplasmata archaeon]